MRNNPKPPTSHEQEQTAPDRAEKLYMENTLLRVSGALFCHDPKRAGKRTGKIELSRGEKDRHISIRLDPEYGQPGPLAHKIFVALIKKHSDYGRPVPEEVSFTRREIGRLIERQKGGGGARDRPAPRPLRGRPDPPRQAHHRITSRRALHVPESLPDDAPRHDRAGALYAIIF